MKFSCLLASLVAIGTISIGWSADQPAKNYIFGVLPYVSATRLEPIYAPVSVEMSRALGRTVDFRTTTEDRLFFQKLEQQSYDFALIQPFWYPPAIDQFNYIPLVRFSEPLTAVIMVLADNPATSIDDLIGKTVATPPEITPIAHLIRRDLKQRGLRPGEDIELKAFRAIDSCIQQVIINAASACVGPHFAPRMLETKLNIQLRTILETSGIPNFLIVAHSRVPLEERRKIKEMLLSWGNGLNDKHLNLLKRINTRRLVPAIDTDYDVVRSFLSDMKINNN